MASERRAWSAKGGQHKSNRRRASKGLTADVLTMQELAGVLCRALSKVEEGTMEPNVANSMATLARTIAAVQQAGEIEERLAALEERAGIMDRGGVA